MINEDWIQIPVAPKYEINRRGDVRNRESKRVVKPWTPPDRKHDRQVSLRIVTGGKTKSFHVGGLLRLTHGIISKHKTHSRLPVPVVVSSGNQIYYFKTCRQAAHFLATVTPNTTGYIFTRLAVRVKEFCCWRINYQR